MSAPGFPPTIYVTLRPEGDGEALEAMFRPEDADGVVAVYELRSIGRVETTTRFVEETTALEQRRDASA